MAWQVEVKHHAYMYNMLLAFSNKLIYLLLSVNDFCCFSLINLLNSHINSHYHNSAQCSSYQFVYLVMHH